MLESIGKVTDIDELLVVEDDGIKTLLTPVEVVCTIIDEVDLLVKVDDVRSGTGTGILLVLCNVVIVVVASTEVGKDREYVIIVVVGE